jgi:hypothetical protein
MLEILLRVLLFGLSQFADRRAPRVGVVLDGHLQKRRASTYEQFLRQVNALR